MTKHIYILFALIFCVMFAACIAEIDSAYSETDPAGWGGEHIARASFENSDTLSLRSMDFFVICNGKLFREHDSLEVQVTITSPDSMRTVETILFSDGDSRAKDGQPARGRFRKHSGFREISTPYMRGALLPVSGEYTFEFTPRSATPIEGVKAIGINIVRE